MPILQSSTHSARSGRLHAAARVAFGAAVCAVAASPLAAQSPAESAYDRVAKAWATHVIGVVEPFLDAPG